MAGSEALVVVGDWISEHYFTAVTRNESFHARVLARRKEGDDAETGSSVRSRFTQARGRLETDLAGLYDAESSPPDVTELYARMQTVLGYHTGEFEIRTHGPAQFFATPGVDAEPLVLITARPIANLDEIGDRAAETLTEPYRTEDDEMITSVPRLLSTLFVAADGPTFALVQAGRWMIIADRDRWPEGRYLGVDLQLVAERNDTKRGGEIDRALACVAAQSLAPDAEGQLWWSATLEDSVSTRSASARISARASVARSRSLPTRSSRVARPVDCPPSRPTR